MSMTSEVSLKVICAENAMRSMIDGRSSAMIEIL
jgi:hypothetical protein